MILIGYIPSALTMITSCVLSLIVLRKAGFDGLWLATALGPFGGMVFGQLVWGVMRFDGDGVQSPLIILATFGSFALGALPLIVLAFKRWPIKSATEIQDGLWK